MSGNTNQFRPQNMWEPDTDWGPGGVSDRLAYKAGDDMVLNAEELSYHQSSYGETQPQQYNVQNPAQSAKMAFFYDQRQSYPADSQFGYGGAQQTTRSVPQPQISNFDDEPPLLEELGIEPDKIVKKVMVVLDPFKSSVPLGDYDLAGPLAFCLLLAVTMLFSGGKVNFGYVYGLALIGCCAMYMLLRLMTSADQLTLTSVASVLGYCILPVCILSFIGIFLNLRSPIGYGGASLAVFWASLAASRMFVTMSTDFSQRPLIAYPCALLYGVFTLLVVF